ncbi:HTH-type transcriptional regulator McbR [Corynebacterium faecale]|uniref:GntR family transcriptional regulator n=1 Tax=Corynebacterium faecale TaxID=1758466 RepID=UPI0025B36981|nr:GntR family transcriptional regulator [Corynebacterium faecale]WJY91675.1 HTH-type transcriptional regulator McbR [Corynebacterium faecale]
MSEQITQSDAGKKKASLSSIAETSVRERILSGELKSGTVVRPEDVGRELGISQTPAREALQTLKAQGFLTSEAGVGFVVVPLTTQDISDIFTAHALLAGEIAARAVTNAAEEDIAELEAIHFELMAASKRRDWELVEDRNHAFHRHITKLADSPKLAHVLRIVSRYIPRTFYSSVGGWVEASVHDHDDILTAFREKDAIKARAAMSEHMVNAGELLAQTIATD